MMCYCDHEMPTLYSEEWRHSRKPRTCCECRGPIATGELYQRVAGVWDGEFTTYTTCERCADLRESLSAVACPALGELRIAYVEFMDNAGLYAKDADGERAYHPNHMIGANGNGRHARKSA